MTIYHNHLLFKHRILLLMPYINIYDTISNIAYLKWAQSSVALIRNIIWCEFMVFSLQHRLLHVFIWKRHSTWLCFQDLPEMENMLHRRLSTALPRQPWWGRMAGRHKPDVPISSSSRRPLARSWSLRMGGERMAGETGPRDYHGNYCSGI